MSGPHTSELVFEVKEEPEGGYSAVSQGDTWEELRAMVKDAVEGYFFDAPKPQTIRLHLVRDEVLTM